MGGRVGPGEPGVLARAGRKEYARDQEMTSIYTCQALTSSLYCRHEQILHPGGATPKRLPTLASLPGPDGLHQPGKCRGSFQAQITALRLPMDPQGQT